MRDSPSLHKKNFQRLGKTIWNTGFDQIYEYINLNEMRTINGEASLSNKM